MTTPLPLIQRRLLQVLQVTACDWKLDARPLTRRLTAGEPARAPAARRPVNTPPLPWTACFAY